MKHVMLKYMYVQDVVEKKLTNLAYISTKQNKTDLMTKCHTSEAHKRGCAVVAIETRLKRNQEVKMQHENETKRINARRSPSAVLKSRESAESNTSFWSSFQQEF